jgi:hypothetical protein
MSYLTHSSVILQFSSLCPFKTVFNLDIGSEKRDFPPDICGNVIEHLNEEIER